MLNHAAGSAFKRPDLKIVTAGILCRQRYQLEFTSQLVVLGQPQLCLKWEKNTGTGQTQSQTRLIWHVLYVIIIKLLFHYPQIWPVYTVPSLSLWPKRSPRSTCAVQHLRETCWGWRWTAGAPSSLCWSSPHQLEWTSGSATGVGDHHARVSEPPGGWLKKEK